MRSRTEPRTRRGPGVLVGPTTRFTSAEALAGVGLMRRGEPVTDTHQDHEFRARETGKMTKAPT